MQLSLRSAFDPAVRMAIYPQTRVVKNICMDDSFINHHWFHDAVIVHVFGKNVKKFSCRFFQTSE